MLLCRVALCQGKFPNFLMDAWDEYDFRKDSDNDRPGKTDRQTDTHTHTITHKDTDEQLGRVCVNVKQQ